MATDDSKKDAKKLKKGAKTTMSLSSFLAEGTGTSAFPTSWADSTDEFDGESGYTGASQNREDFGASGENYNRREEGGYSRNNEDRSYGHGRDSGFHREREGGFQRQNDYHRREGGDDERRNEDRPFRREENASSWGGNRSREDSFGGRRGGGGGGDDFQRHESREYSGGRRGEGDDGGRRDGGYNRQRRNASPDSREQREPREPREPREREPKEFPTKPPYYLFIGNLDYRATDDDIRNFFEGSKVSRIEIQKDKGTGRPRGFGYVHFEDLDSLKLAYEKNNETLLERQVRTDLPDTRNEQPTRSESGTWRRETQPAFVETSEKERGERGDRSERRRFGDFNDVRERQERGERGERGERPPRSEPKSEGPRERTKLELLPRTNPEPIAAAAPAKKSNIFGEARPRDELEAQRKKDEERTQREQTEKEKSEKENPEKSSDDKAEDKAEGEKKEKEQEKGSKTEATSEHSHLDKEGKSPTSGGFRGRSFGDRPRYNKDREGDNRGPRGDRPRGGSSERSERGGFKSEGFRSERGGRGGNRGGERSFDRFDRNSSSGERGARGGSTSRGGGGGDQRGGKDFRGGRDRDSGQHHNRSEPREDRRPREERHGEEKKVAKDDVPRLPKEHKKEEKQLPKKKTEAVTNANPYAALSQVSE